MMHVTFKEIPGEFAEGERRLVPDKLAEALKKEGKISAMEKWPPAPDSTDTSKGAQKPHRPMLKPSRPTGSPDQRIAR